MLKNKTINKGVDLKARLNKLQYFVSGANLENVLNEAALAAARRSKTRIDAKVSYR